MDRVRRTMGRQPSLLLWCAVCVLLIFLFVRLPDPASSDRRRFEITFTHDLVDYRDTTQLTDYALLDSLLKKEQGNETADMRMRVAPSE